MWELPLNFQNTVPHISVNSEQLYVTVLTLLIRELNQRFQDFAAAEGISLFSNQRST